MNIYAKQGDRIVCVNLEAGYLPDQENAKKHLTVGQIYTVHGWHTNVWIKEVPGILFNSVTFEDYKENE